MNFEEIKQDILRWNEIRANRHALEEYFEQGNSFEFEFGIPLNYQEQPLHAYPAISNGRLVFYLISSANDSSTVFGSIGSGFVGYILKAEVVFNEASTIGGTKISRQEALKRIANWKNHSNTWVRDKSEAGGIYQAFEVPVTSIPAGTALKAFFALAPDDELSSDDFQADLIITDSINLLFYDTVRPVPPFGQGGEAAFFVLEAALAQ